METIYELNKSNVDSSTCCSYILQKHYIHRDTMKGTNQYFRYQCPIVVETSILFLVKLGIGMLCIITFFETVAAQTKFEPVRINCGGPRYVDPVTRLVWVSDSSKYVTRGTPVSKCNDRFLTFVNTTSSMREIYCSHRSFKPSFDVQPNYYTIPVLNTTSSYIVRLHFAEMVCYVNI